MSDTTPPPPPEEASGGSQPPPPPPAQPGGSGPAAPQYSSTYREAYGQPHGDLPAGYVPPAYGSGPGVGAPQNHGSATTALVLGLLSFLCCGLLGIPAYIIGRRADREIAASGGRLTGEGLAKAGWILGLISIVLMILSALLVVVLLVTGSFTASFDGNTGSGY
ncbi:DUF4190 domain-containing protein [Nocardioides taihuensis]|uniref:DUF4190 domain-containing protein n=1 Tax=Nocardioides taihuensis TaxID=1835606 RepID=A0ABW0BNN4_9ACTN